MGAKKKGDAGSARPLVVSGEESRAPRAGGTPSRRGAGGWLPGGGVDRHTTLSDTRFSVLEETASERPAAGRETAKALSNRLTTIDLIWFLKG